MVSIATVLERLKDECKKDITKTSSSSSSSTTIDCDYNVVSIKLFGENYLIKKVSMASVSSYKVGWVLNNQINSCMKCDISFGMFHWRHHCRSCGDLVCKRCGMKRLAIAELKVVEPLSRVCKGCFHSYSQSNSNPMISTTNTTNSTSTTINTTKKEDNMTSTEEDYLSYDLIHNNNNNTKAPSRLRKEETCSVKDNNNNNNNNNNSNNNSNNTYINDNDKSTTTTTTSGGGSGSSNLSPTLTSFDHTTRLYVPKIRLSIQDSGNPLLRSPKALSLRRSSRGGGGGGGGGCDSNSNGNGTIIITDSLSPSACYTSIGTKTEVNRHIDDITHPVSSVDNDNTHAIVTDGSVSLIHGGGGNDNDDAVFNRPPVVQSQSTSSSQMDSLFLCPYTIDIKPRRKSITTISSAVGASARPSISSSTSSISSSLSSSSAILILSDDVVAAPSTTISTTTISTTTAPTTTILDIKTESSVSSSSTTVIIDQTPRTQSTNSSITSIDTKTAANTKINANITASIPLPISLPEVVVVVEEEVEGVVEEEVNTHSPDCIQTIKYTTDDQTLRTTSPTTTTTRIISSSSSSSDDNDCLVDQLTPTSTIYSPLLTDIEKFGTPGTRYSILAEAQSNIIWEASDIDDDDGDGGTSIATSVTTPISSSSSSLSLSALYVNKSTTKEVTSIINMNMSSLLHQRNFDDIESENIQPSNQNSPNRNTIYPNEEHDKISSPNKLSSTTIIIDNLCHHHQLTNTALVSTDEVLPSTQDDDVDNNILTNALSSSSSSSSPSSRFNQTITLCKSDNDQVDQKYVNSNNHISQMNVMKRIQHFDALSAKRSTPLKLSLPTSSSSSSLPSSSLLSSSINQSPAFNRIRSIPAPHSINRGLPELRQQQHSTTRSSSRDV